MFPVYARGNAASESGLLILDRVRVAFPFYQLNAISH